MAKMAKKWQKNALMQINTLAFKAILIILFAVVPVFAFEGKVMQVKDGDTVVIAPAKGGQFFICRLYGIDAPETAKRGKQGQPYGNEAMRVLKRLTLGQEVTVELTGQKTYNRQVCRIYLNGRDVNLEMVMRGYAWAYVKYLKRPYASEYITAEAEARANKLGLWKDVNPIPPWEWRKSLR